MRGFDSLPPAGSPEGDQVMGSYESYARVMGGILGSCGVGKFLANRARKIIRNSEPGRWNVLVSEWHRLHELLLTPPLPLWLPPPSFLRLCDALTYVVSSRLMAAIQPFLDRERHITICSQPRTARASPGHRSMAMATWTHH